MREVDFEEMSRIAASLGDNSIDEMELAKEAEAIDKAEALAESRTKYIEAEISGDIRNRFTYGDVEIIELKKGGFGVKCRGEFVVPFGKYGWIDGFEYGLARVRTNGKTTYTKNIVGVISLDTDGKLVTDPEKIAEHTKKEQQEHPEHFAKWGIINEQGEEVLPVEYDDIWKFFGKSRYTTKAIKGGQEYDISLNDLSDKAQKAPWLRRMHREVEDDYDSYGGHYGEFAGSYAQDVMGYDDDTINDAFEGDPDCYWNID